MRCNLIILSLSLFVLVRGQDECGECDRSQCSPLDYCVFGVEKDICNCCDVCTKRLGQTCDLKKTTRKHGNCGEFLACTENKKDGYVGTCKCSEPSPICGSDDVTYDNLCELLETAQNSIDLTVVERSPCRKGPIIKSPPKDARRPLNSLLLLDCEAYGIPVPTISWELNKPDGSTVRLPSDDPSAAVQVRGGPEENMATGWVQIMKITRDNVGLYTCVATNNQGETRASANVTYRKERKTRKPKRG